MDNASQQESLLAWALATFHTAFFIVALVSVLYWLGSLGGLLGSLNTLLGFALFGILWLSTWWTTRRTLRRVARLYQAPSFAELVWGVENPPLFSAGFFSQAVWWGGVNGAVFFLCILGLLLVNTLVFILANPGEDVGLINLVFLGLIGVIVAGIVGAAAGLVLAVIDALLLIGVRRLFLMENAPVSRS